MNFNKITSLLVISFMLGGCGIQAIPKSKNLVEAGLAEVTNQYKRRSDLIPNLVETVKGYAKHEKSTLESVAQARAQATSMTIDPAKVTPEQLVKWQEAQGQLSQALGRLLALSERYPDLKADRNFRELQAQLEGTENRIAIARQRYIETIQHFNNLVTVPPYNWTNALFFHYQKMPQWGDEVKPEEKTAPKVNF